MNNNIKFNTIAEANEYKQLVRENEVSNKLKEYTYIATTDSDKTTLHPIWSVALDFAQAQMLFNMMNEKRTQSGLTHYNLIAILEGNYLRANTDQNANIIMPTKQSKAKQYKRTKQEKLVYYKGMCEYLQIEI